MSVDLARGTGRPQTTVTCNVSGGKWPGPGDRDLCLQRRAGYRRPLFGEAPTHRQLLPWTQPPIPELLIKLSHIRRVANGRTTREPCHFDTLDSIGIEMTSAADGESHFQMTESFDEAGVLWLSLIGELDLSVADDLATRLQQLHEQGLEVRLDLTQLEFIDSTGIRELMCALDSSRRAGSRLTVGTDMTTAVRRVVEAVGAGSYFRPDGG
ncbi:MAG TPA: STAS domain-containing protein [Solirubrobacteraceae bacterium]|nr:STAS domain-containing protein [Solirubrobacteraceae bacterium]